MTGGAWNKSLQQNLFQSDSVSINKKEITMKDLFQLDTAEIQKLETLLANSVEVSPTTLEGMAECPCGGNCSNGCGDQCTGPTPHPPYFPQ
jgi:hypothetical protein